MIETLRSVTGVVVTIFAIALANAPVFAETVALKAALSAAAEVPATDSKGAGQGTFTYNTDTKQLRFTITYRGLTGPATAGHIHGPAAPGANAGVIVPFAVPESPISGTATLTEGQAAALMAGQTYVNIHTDANKSGEIRGQIEK
jgi:Cu/Zn superoxide dismutase